MSNIDKRALREAAVRAGGVKWQYMRATQHTKAYLTDEKGWTVVNCTDGDVPAKCAGFIESANPATVLALLDELEAKDKRIAELEAREVVLPSTQDVHPLGPQSAKIFCEFHRSIVNRCADEIRKVGVKVSIKGN
ncbi:ead/Ea22-like family protein [Enterobacter hormaechei]|uniref:ead/Ea22-like family protein n=1 Tax=Enterobacter hormaechei TaxID=158836 RepID=UPI00187DDFD3|nr:ead/Ea22-like family protein [Enterobacter hormaechei]MBE8821273.1 ead/Ea22-like family protein [Enterobacter hormaechei]MBE8837062.1 ead/Ea22-like family protein [Enterobacter hormaechei]MBE8964406.1 ead/Ea22-like family protein [Enterobacter hormaechei]